MIIWTPAVLSVLYAYVLYFCICTCYAQLSMFHMERRSRNTLIIIIIKVEFQSQEVQDGYWCTGGKTDKTKNTTVRSRRQERSDKPWQAPARSTPASRSLHRFASALCMEVNSLQLLASAVWVCEKNHHTLYYLLSVFTLFGMTAIALGSQGCWRVKSFYLRPFHSHVSAFSEELKPLYSMASAVWVEIKPLLSWYQQSAVWVEIKPLLSMVSAVSVEK